PRCVYFKGTSTIRNRMDGVSTYLALTFGTLLSSQGTDASFVLTLSGFPPCASLRCFRLYQIFFLTVPPVIGVRLPGRWAVPTSWYYAALRLTSHSCYIDLTGSAG